MPPPNSMLEKLKAAARRQAITELGARDGTSGLNDTQRGRGVENVFARANEIAVRNAPSIGAEWVERIPELLDRETAAKSACDPGLMTADLAIVAAVNLQRILLEEVIDALRDPYGGERLAIVSLRDGLVRYEGVIDPLDAPWLREQLGSPFADALADAGAP